MRHPSSAHGALIAALVVTAAIPPAARAEGDVERRAEQLFREGRAAIDRGDFATGCVRFRESLEVTKRPSTLLNLASCEEHQGELTAALGHWREGIALLPAADERAVVATKRVAALDARVPRLTLRPAPGAPADLAVELDGRPLAPAALGEARPVDPREHVIVVSAAGRAPVRTTLRLAEGERRELALEVGAPTSPGPAAPAEAAAPGSGARTAGFAIGGAGLAGVVVGAVLGGLTIGKKGKVDDLCRHPSTCTSTAAKDAATAGKAFSAGSSAAFAIGGAALAAGIILVATSPSAKEPKAAVGAAPLPGGAALWLTGRL